MKNYYALIDAVLLALMTSDALAFGEFESFSQLPQAQPVFASPEPVYFQPYVAPTAQTQYQAKPTVIYVQPVYVSPTAKTVWD